MFAIIKSGGRQYRVSQGDKITLDRVDAEQGATITLGDVLAVGNGSELTMGAPLVKGASVQAEVLKKGKSDTIIVFKKKRRQNYRRRNGHRQHETLVEIKSIKAA